MSQKIASEVNCAECGVVDPRAELWRYAGEINWLPLSADLRDEPPPDLDSMKGWSIIVVPFWSRTFGEYQLTHEAGYWVWARDDYSAAQGLLKLINKIKCDCSSWNAAFNAPQLQPSGFYLSSVRVQIPGG